MNKKLLKTLLLGLCTILPLICAKADDLISISYTEVENVKLYNKGDLYYLESPNPSYASIAFRYDEMPIPTPIGKMISLNDPSTIGDLEEFTLIKEFNLYYSESFIYQNFDFDFPVDNGDGTFTIGYLIQFGISEFTIGEMPANSTYISLYPLISVPEPASAAAFGGLAALAFALHYRRKLR